MAFKKLLVPLTEAVGDGEARGPTAALDIALSMGARHDSHVEAYFCAPRSGSKEAVLPAGLPGSTAELLIAEMEKAVDQQRHAAEALFDAAMAKHEPPRRTEPDEGDGFSVAFVEETGLLEARLPMRARLADLSVVGLNADDAHVSRTLELCLRESGRPVLAVPPACSAWRDRTIAIGWNGSVEAAHVISVATDLLTQAETVTVIAIDEDGPTEPGAADLAAALAWHGITADTVTLDGSRDTAGAMLLERAAAVGADLLVMGAYTRSRFSQLIFGSATADVLAAATIPVLMMH